jgi:hypothetical protein
LLLAAAEVDMTFLVAEAQADCFITEAKLQKLRTVQH